MTVDCRVTELVVVKTVVLVVRVVEGTIEVAVAVVFEAIPSPSLEVASTSVSH